MNANVWSPSRGPMPPPKPWPCVVDSSYVPPLQTPRRISGWRLTCTVTARRSASGAPGIWRTGWPVCRMRCAPVGRGAFPPSERLDVLSLATSTPADYHGPATRWRLDDLTAALRAHARARAMSRSTLWRMLDEADLKPPRSVYWLQSHAPAFEAKARDICHLDVHALRFSQHGRLGIGVDAKTGMQMLQRKHPTPWAQPGKPEKRAHAYLRHGVRVLSASFVVPTGPVRWPLGPTRTSEDCAAHLAHVLRPLPAMQHYDWVVDNRHTHWSLEVCRRVAAWCDLPFVPKALQRGVQRRAVLSDPTHKHVLHCTPKHGSWLTQVVWWGGGWLAVFSSAGIFVRSTTLRLSCLMTLRCTTPIMRIRIGGPLPGNRWSGPRPSVKPGGNSGRDGHGLALAPTVLHVLCTPLGRINGLRLNW